MSLYYFWVLDPHCYSINRFPKICNGYTSENVCLFIYLFFLFIPFSMLTGIRNVKVIKCMFLICLSPLFVLYVYLFLLFLSSRPHHQAEF